jgi:uncharacterized membrane protein YgdD (TMEM256/DUF423 family)
MTSTLGAIGAILGALGVAAGAFGAHALKDLVEPRLLAVWNTGATYHLLHAILLTGTGWLASARPGIAVTVAAWAFLGGILCFSGSLYLLVLTGQHWLGAITPIGGGAFIAGWVALAIALWP